jgi:putative ABC transport system ATP-binding protein
MVLGSRRPHVVLQFLMETIFKFSKGTFWGTAIARALANDLSLILADEPTGNLDSKTGEEIMGLFVKLQQQGRTILMVTHDNNIAAYSQRTIRLLDGRIV